jgi:hypothetical protein
LCEINPGNNNWSLETLVKCFLLHLSPFWNHFLILFEQSSYLSWEPHTCRWIRRIIIFLRTSNPMRALWRFIFNCVNIRNFSLPKIQFNSGMKIKFRIKIVSVWYAYGFAYTWNFNWINSRGINVFSLIWCLKIIKFKRTPQKIHHIFMVIGEP